MNCPSCGYENPDPAKFCLECGAAFATRFASCDTELPAGAKFCLECGAAVSAGKPAVPDRAPRDYTPRHLADKILRSKSALEGERKQVTVLFADVKGSMDLAEQVDPEEWHRILNRFFEILTDGVHRFEGTVNQYTGDGIMALFGAPIAHEDHAQRACYAALRLGDELRRYADELRRTRGLNFSVRMGLNSGEVVVGKIGDDLRMDYTAQGHTVGLAARMEQLAEPGKVYLTEHTAGWVEGFCRLYDLGSFDVKGVQEPIRVFELQGVGPLRTRLEVAASRGLVRFVGRQGEMEQLCRAWEAAEVGRGQIAAVVGEAGVGKSRLVYEFKAQLGSQCQVLEALSVSHGKATAYLPLIELLKSYFRIVLADDGEQRRERITDRVRTLDRALEDTLPYLFSLLGLADPTAALAQMDPETRRRRTLEAVKRVLVRETLEQPCVLIFEDLQWIDAETQAFLDVMSESVATARLLLLVDYRPEYQHAWGGRTYYTQVRLDPLGEQEARELMAALLGEGISAEREVLETVILEKTEGNPFFMEEVVQTLAEEGVLAGERGSYRLEKAPSQLHIPATVQGVLAARIDRLPAQEKEFLQALSVMGKEIPYGLLRKVAGRSEEELYRLLSHLQAGEFIYEQPAFPEPEYTFKHALTQEVAYHSVLVERRKVLHEQTARGIEELYQLRSRRALQRAGPSLQPDRQHREGRRVLAACRPTGSGTVGLQGSDPPAHQGAGAARYAAQDPRAQPAGARSASRPWPGTDDHQRLGRPGGGRSLLPGAGPLSPGGRDLSALRGAVRPAGSPHYPCRVAKGTRTGEANPQPGSKCKRREFPSDCPPRTGGKLAVPGRAPISPSTSGTGHRPIRPKAASLPVLHLWRVRPRGGFALLRGLRPVGARLSGSGFGEKPGGLDPG